MEHRLVELEIRLGLAEHLVDELNLTVYRQQQQLDLLQEQLRHLHRQLEEGLAAGGRRPASEEIPPHY